MEFNYCRRCGNQLTQKAGNAYKCSNGHTIFANSSPAVALILENDKSEILVVTRKIDPKKGCLDFPGGFCDGRETIEQALLREVEEEVGIKPDQYTTPTFLRSGIENYKYENEQIPVLSVEFHAYCKSEVTLIPKDDVETAGWMPIKNLPVDKIAFETLKDAYYLLLKTKD
jgi:mutator protein MutT